MLLNIKDSAEFIKVSRTTLYKKIASGELSKSDNSLLDTSELLRVFGSPENRDLTRKKKQLDTVKLTLDTNPEIELLKEKIRFLESNLSEARNREEWLKGQVDKLTETIKLLEAPKDEPKKSGLFSRLFS